MRRGMAEALQTQRRLLGNTALLAGAEAEGQVVNLVFVVGLARVLGREVLGTYAFAMSVGAVAAVVVSHGTHTVLLRQLSRAPEETSRATDGVIGYQVTVALMIVLAVHLAARWFAATPEHVWVVTFVVAFHVLMRLAHLLSIGPQERRKMEAAAALKAAPRIVSLLLAGLAVLWGASAALTLASMPAAAFITVAATALVWALRFGRPRPRTRHADVAA
jgi:O-antigen/teichoic acid export membrane protein